MLMVDREIKSCYTIMAVVGLESQVTLQATFVATIDLFSSLPQGYHEAHHARDEPRGQPSPT